MSHIYNLKKSSLDGTEKVYDHKKYAAAPLPPSFDLRPSCPPVYDQGQQGSCTANAGCAARSMLNNDPALLLSRAFQYYQERALEGNTGEDAGASMKDIGVALKDYGCCLDTLMPYSDADYSTAPTPADKAAALAYKISGSSLVYGIDGIKQALVSRNQPVLCGMTVYASMEDEQTEKTGVLPMPKKREQILGGHAVLVVGYTPTLPSSALYPLVDHIAQNKLSIGDAIGCAADILSVIHEIIAILHDLRDPAGYLIVRNSWGAAWGDAGYFYMPYAYALKGYADEFWILEK